MIRILSSLIVPLLVLAVLAVPRPAQSDDSFKILVVVNGKPITNVDFEEKLEIALISINSQLKKQGRDPLTMSDLRKQKEITDRILDQYIEEILLQQEIDRYELTVSEEELDARIAAIQQSRGISEEEMREVLAKTDETLEGFREQLRTDLLKHQLIRGKVGKKIVVTETEVMDEYKKRASLESGVLVHLALILLPPDQPADKVLEEIKDGDKTFAEAADAYSVGAGVGEGGDLGWLDMGDMAEDWREAVVDLEDGEISEPFDANGQQAMIMLVERKQGEATMDETLKDQIFEEIREQKFQETLDEYLDTIRTQALIQYKNSY